MIAWYAYAMLATLQQPLQPAPKPNLNQAPPPASQAMPSIAPSAVAADEKPPIAPWQGTLRAGQAKLQELSLAQKFDEALELSNRLLAMSSWEKLPERQRAEALYAIGVARGTADKIEGAVDAFQGASGLAGSDSLGLDSMYGAGTYRLLKAEDLRKNIPEIREKLGLQPLPPTQAPPVQLAPPGPGTSTPSAPQPEPDALSIAKEAYLAARRDLVERLRCDTSDRDTRGNLELTQRRLRELDALEQKRKDDEQKQKDQQKQDKDQKPNDQQNKDQQKQDQQDKQDESKNDQQKQDDKQPPKDQQKPEDQPKPDEKKDEQKADPKEEKPKDAQPDPKSAEKEQVLSDEEVMRLLDQLRQIEQQAEQVRAALRERHRVPVKKDW